MILGFGKRVFGVIAVASVIQVSAQQPASTQSSPVQDQAGTGVPLPPGQNPLGMRIYIRAGLKSHGPGLHDYPQFLADWSKLLTQHGARVDGSLHSPTSAELESVDVVVIYKGDAGYMTARERTDLEAFARRGGGLVSLHDALCGPDPTYFATLVGGGKKHGETNYTLLADVPYTIVDRQHPITLGLSDFVLQHDEAFFSLTWAKELQIHVLASAVIASTPSAIRAGHAGEVVPQIWTYEHTLPAGTAPAFVWMQGHTYANFSDPTIQTLLLRGIAWAAKRPVDELVEYHSRN